MYIFLKLKTQIIIWWKAVSVDESKINRANFYGVWKLLKCKDIFLEHMWWWKFRERGEKNRKLPFFCSSAFRIIRALNKPVYGLIRNDLMRRRKKKQFIFCEVIKNLNRFAGIIWEKREKRKLNVVRGIVFTWTFSICQKFHERFRNH